MRARVLGGGWYGCHLALALRRAGHQIELYEVADHLFAGASGGNPARLHLGPHYPRSKLTRALCQEHYRKFLDTYGHLTRAVPVNLYAVASSDSLVDFGTYKQVLTGEIEFVTVENPAEFGLEGVEGAILTGERHIVIDQARAFFDKELNGSVFFSTDPREPTPSDAWTIDCTFSANSAEGIDRYEPCLTVLLKGPTDRAVTIMDGPFPSIYPWNEDRGLCTLTSARYTPLANSLSYAEAKNVLRTMKADAIKHRAADMFAQACSFWPAARELFEPVEMLLKIRAMPRSAAAARLVDVVRTGERSISVRAGKIDAILHAEQLVKDILRGADA